MKIQVILGSSRPERVGDRIAKWVVASAQEQTDFDVELVDLRDYDLPHFDEPMSPKFNPNRPLNAVTKRWLDKINTADGYIILTPEYNHSVPGHLKDALDYIDWQLDKKAVAIVGYGSVGGVRAVEHLRQIVNFLGAAVVPYTVSLNNPAQLIDESGAFIGEQSQFFGRPAALKTLLGDLAWWTSTLKAGRAEKAAV